MFGVRIINLQLGWFFCRLPLPGCVLAMFPDEVNPQTEDSSLHGGRVRSFKHERGNWATYLYVPCKSNLEKNKSLWGPDFSCRVLCLLLSPDHPEEEFQELLEELLSVAGTRGVAMTPQEEFHLSLSQTVVLRHHWIQPFTQSLRASLAHCKRFVGLSLSYRKVLLNEKMFQTNVVYKIWNILNEKEIITRYENYTFYLYLFTTQDTQYVCERSDWHESKNKLEGDIVTSEGDCNFRCFMVTGLSAQQRHWESTVMLKEQGIVFNVLHCRCLSNVIILYI